MCIFLGFPISIRNSQARVQTAMEDIIDSAYVNVVFFLCAFQKTQKEVIRLKVILRNFFFNWSKSDISFLELTEHDF